MIRMQAPDCNLFFRAPCELSQDAFICWLLGKWTTAECDLRDVARQFTGLLFGSYLPFHWWQVKDVLIEQQKRLALNDNYVIPDMLVQYELSDGLPWLLVIEDKVDAGGDPDQLQRQWEAVRNACCDGRIMVDANRVHATFVKTGFDFDFKPPDPWNKVNYRRLRMFLDKVCPPGQRGTSEILDEWLAWCRNQLSVIEERTGDPLGAMERLSGPDACKKPDGLLGDQRFQFAFLKCLFGLTTEQALTTGQAAAATKPIRDGLSRVYYDTPLNGITCLLYGADPGGTCFSQYWFDSATSEGNPSLFFFRLQFTAKGWSLQLRNYSPGRTPQQIFAMESVARQFGTICKDNNIECDVRTRFPDCNEATFARISLCTRPNLKEFYNLFVQFCEKTKDLRRAPV
jgi:hypothetical protein